MTRGATAADFAAFGREVPYTVRAWVIEKDGRPAAIGGYFVKRGWAHVFSEIREPLPKMTIWREAMKHLTALKMPAVCEADPNVPGSGRFLERLGWEHAGTVDGREVYTWQH